MRRISSTVEAIKSLESSQTPRFCPTWSTQCTNWSDLQYWLRPHLSQLQLTIPPLQWSQWMTGMALRCLAFLQALPVYPQQRRAGRGYPQPVQIIGDSSTESDKTEDLEPEEDSSYTAQVFPSTSDCALRKQTHSKSDGSKDSQDGAPSPKRVTIKKEKEVDNNESSSSTGLSDKILRDHSFTVYGKDSTAVHEVRAKIFSLKAGMRPSHQDIDSSPIFALRMAADESRSPSIIGQHWVPYLEQEGHLADCKPKDFTYKDGWLPLYTRAGITKHLSGLKSLLNKDKTSPLIAVILLGWTSSMSENT